jgi:hypothetical protein
LFERDFVFLGMVLKEKYTTLQRTLDCMQTQIEDSLSFARNFVPRGETPRSLFSLLKAHTTYRHDPPGVELLQSMPTLISNNFYGIPGAGDCDCLTIAAVSCLVVEKIPVRIVVVGNTAKNPTHVYCEVLDGGRWTPFDLCSPFYGDTKKYRYLSIIKVK